VLTTKQKSGFSGIILKFVKAFSLTSVVLETYYLVLVDLAAQRSDARPPPTHFIFAVYCKYRKPRGKNQFGKKSAKIRQLLFESNSSIIQLQVAL
jgi:hypothetical protein